ncbi:hypothetical protein [Natronococcus sp.]|uniref:hypothetical protein n=1 Tax=Natronococcus sp. TaxID=35747 RepID=UPI0025F11083|nr:hypothetical protein [Natronococcus sp.]
MGRRGCRPVTLCQALAGSPLALALVAVLVGGPASVVAGWLLVRHDSLPTWLDRLYLTDRLSRRGIAVAIVGGAAFVGIVGFFWPRGTVLLAFAGTFVLAMVSSAAEGAGQILFALPLLVLVGGVSLGYACYESWLARRERDAEPVG